MEQSPSSQAEAAQEPKKVSLAEAMKQKLAQKKQAQAQGSATQSGHSKDVKQMRSQIKKKPNNQKKRTGV